MPPSFSSHINYYSMYVRNNYEKIIFSFKLNLFQLIKTRVAHRGSIRGKSIFIYSHFVSNNFRNKTFENIFFLFEILRRIRRINFTEHNA